MFICIDINKILNVFTRKIVHHIKMFGQAIHLKCFPLENKTISSPVG